MTYNKQLGYAAPSSRSTNNMIDQPSAGAAFQTQIFKVGTRAFQALIKYYNSYALRILYDFTSRGLKSGTGNNMHGNPVATGQNWASTSTETGYPVTNLNTDIVEQYWRTADGVNSVVLTLDAEYPQGILIDTLCFFNHNLSNNATVQWQRSDDSGFASVDTVTLEVTKDNLYWISEELPTHQYRYHRFIINDSSKILASDYIQIGTIVAGSAFIMVGGEDIVDNIIFGYKEYADKIETEGYTNVSNSRAVKRNLVVELRSISYTGLNYPNLRYIFNNYRTSLKTVWIPTPSSSDQTLTDRFAVFGKLTNLPQESHNYKGPTAQYIDFTCEVDESL